LPVCTVALTLGELSGAPIVIIIITVGGLFEVGLNQFCVAATFVAAGTTATSTTMPAADGTFRVERQYA
jgi:hypothetical protein